MGVLADRCIVPTSLLDACLLPPPRPPPGLPRPEPGCDRRGPPRDRLLHRDPRRRRAGRARPSLPRARRGSRQPAPKVGEKLAAPLAERDGSPIRGSQRRATLESCRSSMWPSRRYVFDRGQEPPPGARQARRRRRAATGSRSSSTPVRKPGTLHGAGRSRSCPRSRRRLPSSAPRGRIEA